MSFLTLGHELAVEHEPVEVLHGDVIDGRLAHGLVELVARVDDPEDPGRGLHQVEDLGRLEGARAEVVFLVDGRDLRECISFVRDSK